MEILTNMRYKIIKMLTKKKTIVDISGVVLTPGNNGERRKGNGKYKNWRGKTIECCCDECDYLTECCKGND